MSQNEEIRSLNTLRGLAALMVAVYHGPAMFGSKHWFPHAYLAVDLFFVISGFIMAHVYGARVRGGLAFGGFMRRRLARLYPLYLAVTVGGAGLFFWKAAVDMGPDRPELIGALGLNLLLIPADTTGLLSNRAAYPFALQTWSIVWEIVLSGAFFLWARRIGGGALPLALAAGLLLALNAVNRGTLDGGFTMQTFWVGGIRALFGFSAGMAAFEMMAKTSDRTWRALGLAAAPFGVLALFYILTVRRTWWAADLAIVLALFPLLVGYLARLRPRWAEHAVGDFLGQASYSVYLLHGLTIGVAGLWLLTNPYIAQPWRYVFGAAWLASLMVLSWLCWRYFETPARKALTAARRTERRVIDAAA